MLFVLWFTDSDYLFGIFWSLCCLSFDIRILITSLVAFGHYVVCPLIYVFWLPLWYLLVIMLFVLWFTYSDYPFGIFRSLCCLSFDLRILITSLVSFGHYVVCPLIYRFWLPLWYLLVIMLFVLWFTYSDYIPLVSLIYVFWLPIWYLWFTYSDYLFGIFDLRILITSLWYLWFTYSDYLPLVSLIYVFWLPLWYLQTLLVPYYFEIFLNYHALAVIEFYLTSSKHLSYIEDENKLSFFDLWILINTLVSSNSSYNKSGADVAVIVW